MTMLMDVEAAREMKSLMKKTFCFTLMNTEQQKIFFTQNNYGKTLTYTPTELHKTKMKNSRNEIGG